jgi:hypothetical protein
MKRKVRLCSLFLCVLASAHPLRAQVTAFSNNGRLSDNSVPSNGMYEMRFALYDAVETPSDSDPERRSPCLGRSQVLEQTDDINGKRTPIPGATSPFNISALGPGEYFRTRPGP